MRDSRDMNVIDRLRKAAANLDKTAMDPGLSRSLLAGGIGAAGVGIPLALIARAHEQRAKERAGNVGFGAGVATGLAGPAIIHGLYDMTRGGAQ